MKALAIFGWHHFSGQLAGQPAASFPSMQISEHSCIFVDLYFLEHVVPITATPSLHVQSVFIVKIKVKSHLLYKVLSIQPFSLVLGFTFMQLYLAVSHLL